LAIFNRLKSSGYRAYPRLTLRTYVCCQHVCLCVLYRSPNKQPLFSYTAWTDWLLQPRGSVFTAQYKMDL